jgi:CelD/BcsL family acetyltransferase involved in cellulose biosynthesis
VKSDSPYEFILHDSLASLMSLREAWTVLLERFGGCNPFYTWEWAVAWWEVYNRPGDQLSVISVVEHGQVIAIAPLFVRRRPWYGLQRRMLVFLGEGNADRSDILSASDDPEIFKGILSVLISQNNWDIIQLREMPSQSSFLQWVKTCVSLPFWVEQDSLCPYVAFDTERNRQAFEKQLSRNMRSELRNLRNRMERLGAVRILTREISDCFDQAVPKMKEVEGQSSKAFREIDLVFCQNQPFKLQEKFIELAKGSLVPMLTSIEIDEKMISYLYGYLFKNKYYAYNMAFIPEYARLSPGKLAMHETIVHGLENGWHEFDLLRGASYLKSRWSDCSRQQYHLTITQASVINYFFSILVFKARPLLKRLRNAIRKS